MDANRTNQTSRDKTTCVPNATPGVVSPANGDADRRDVKRYGSAPKARIPWQNPLYEQILYDLNAVDNLRSAQRT